MILIDTSILVDYRRNPTKVHESVFLREQVFTCGIVEAELPHGARSAKDLKTIREALSLFPSLPIPERMWHRVGELLFRLKQAGYTIPFQDAALSLLAVEHNMKLWTKDRHYLMIQQVMPMLELFPE